MSPQICRDYQTNGSCRFASACKFAHVDSSASPMGTSRSSHAPITRRNNAPGRHGHGGGSQAEQGWFDDPQPYGSGPFSTRCHRGQQRGSQGPGRGHSGDAMARNRGSKNGHTGPRGANGHGQRGRNARVNQNSYAGVSKPRPTLDQTWKAGLPQDNFRFQSVFPNLSDINDAEYPDPPENITHTPYVSTEQYLQTHFQLLRADCILPVRDAIRSYRDGAVEDNEMMMYTNVRPVALLFAGMGLIHRVSFIVDGRRVNWKQSKRLIPGTIVSLSTDHFETFRFATVVERDSEFLEDPRDLRIGIRFNEPDPKLDFDPDICYVMIEAMQGYFEAYQHVLRCIQDIDPKTLPLQPQIIGLKPELDAPAYSHHVREFRDEGYIQDSVLRFPSILKGATASRPQSHAGEGASAPIQLPVLGALERMMTKEVAVVQGPPGTGKTFLGLLATYNILKECSNAITGSIIVVCQTNHALDQFLEGVMTFEDKVIRLGSRSKSNIVAPRTLYNIRQKYKENPQEARIQGIQSSAPGRFYKMKDKLKLEMLTLLEELGVEYVPIEKLLELGIISRDQHDSFASDDWVTAPSEDENPTVKSWLQEAPRITDLNSISVYDDAILQDDIVPEIDEEDLQDRVEEFLVGTVDETKIAGHSVNVKQSIVCHLRDDMVGDVTPFLSMHNVHDIPPHMRMGVYKIWLQRYSLSIITKLGELNRIFNLVCDNIRAQLRSNDVSILRSARVIGMTTTAASKYHDLLCLLRPKIMICEEASETLEAYLLSALTPSTQHFILIGDHEQLRPSMSVNDLENKNIDVSMFERLVRNNFPFTMLDCQRRMRPEIRRLIKPIYRQLKDHDSVKQYEDVRGFVHNLWFLTHNEPDMLGSNNSHVNMHEVKIATKLALYLLQQGYPPSEITILTMYAGQRGKIWERLRQCSDRRAEQIRVSTVDGFQGEENEIIILSLVRSNTNNSIGFLKTSNRVCVGLSRAKKGLYILGNARLLMDQSKLWKSIVQSLMPQTPEKFRIGNQIQLRCTRHPETISLVGLEADFDMVLLGGCAAPCGEMLRCGHQCPFQCHTSDHLDMRCNHICDKPLPCGKHTCTDNCSDPCRSCKLC